MKQIWKKGLMALCLLASMQMSAQKRTFTHPGLSYTQADLDRMKAMVNAQQEPFYSTYMKMVSERQPSSNPSYTPINQIKEGSFNGTIGSDGRQAHDMALLYHITGNKAYANDAVARLNRYKNLTNASSRGTGPLDNGKIYLLMEAAELMRDYEGWLPEDQEAFRKMLVHPYYSTKYNAEGYMSLDDSKNDVTFYWNIYNQDHGRWGNQGIFAARGLMAMGIYLDNDTIYDRAYRYLTAQPARTDDLPPVTGYTYINWTDSENDYCYTYNMAWGKSNEQFWGNEVLKYYIYRNGQCQEACRDQGHTVVGIGQYAAIAELAWNQGDNLYGELDNRILLGSEYTLRHQMSGTAYPDQPEPWVPSGFTKNEDECTFENGKFYQTDVPSKRWGGKNHTPERTNGGSGANTQILNHYKVRAGLPADRYVWTQRVYDKMMQEKGLENWGASGHQYEWCGWGTLTKYLTAWMAGDAGTWVDGVRKSGIPAAPCTVKAADYDYHQVDGERLTYHNMGKEKSTVYRTDGTVELAMDGEDVYVTDMENGEWMSYTVNFPAPEGNSTAGLKKKYNVYATYRAKEAGGKLFAVVDNGAKKGKELEAAAEWTEKLLGTVEVKCGTAVLRLYVKGKTGVLEVKSLRVAPLDNTILTTLDLRTVAQSIKVYDKDAVDISASNEAVIQAAVDGDKSVSASLGHQHFLVFDFGTAGQELNVVKLYNDGITQDGREKIQVLGNTEKYGYVGAWGSGTATDVLRTNGSVHGGIPIIENNWTTTDGAIGSYTVGPVGKYRYLAVYNWSTRCNISEIEIYGHVNMSGEEEDKEPTAEWEPQPELNVSTTRWYAGEIEKDASATSPEFVLRNTGGSTLVVKAVDVLPAPWSTSFPKDEEVTIEPNQAYRFTVTYTPESEGLSEQTFNLNTNVGNVTLRLSGDAIQPTAIRSVGGDDDHAVMNAVLLPDAQTVRLYAAETASCRIHTIGAVTVKDVDLVAGGIQDVRLSKGVYPIHMKSAGTQRVFKVAVP